MITKFSNSLKESGKLSLAITILFFAGILISTYFLFTLPHSLTMKGGMPSLILAWPVLIKMFIAVGLTFVAGVATINITLQSRKEIVIYVEKNSQEENRALQREEEATNELKDISDFKSALQEANNETEILQSGLNILCQQLQAGQGAIYKTTNVDNKRMLELSYGFALAIGEHASIQYEFGEGLVGQAAASGTTLYLDEIPEGYIKIVSGLGMASPRYLVIIPMRKGQEVRGVLEIAMFSELHESRRKQVEERVNVLAENI